MSEGVREREEGGRRDEGREGGVSGGGRGWREGVVRT